MQPNLTLRLPVEAEEEEFLRAHRATSPEVPSFLHYYEEGMPFRRYLERLVEQQHGVNLPSTNHVPSTFLFAFVGSRIVGRASIRHSLNDFLHRVGGHIGYVVVPEFRRRGYATAILRESLHIAREKCGVRRILVICDDDFNDATVRLDRPDRPDVKNVITGPDLDKPKRRYWIELT